MTDKTQKMKIILDLFGMAILILIKFEILPYFTGQELQFLSGENSNMKCNKINW
jgi:hypothetical protein